MHYTYYIGVSNGCSKFVLDYLAGYEVEIATQRDDLEP
jgi:hypothetical protein